MMVCLLLLSFCLYLSHISVSFSVCLPFTPTLSFFLHLSISLHFLCVSPSLVFLINIDLAVIVGQQGPHISITSNYTRAHTHAHTNTQASINLIASSTHNAPESRPTNYNSNLTLSINMGAILPGWILVKWKMQINIMRRFLWSPIFSPSLFCFLSFMSWVLSFPLPLLPLHIILSSSLSAHPSASTLFQLLIQHQSLRNLICQTSI